MKTFVGPTIEVDVTQQHIISGKMYSRTCCPIALAVREVRQELVTVTEDFIYIGHYKYELPREAKMFIRNFDDFYGSGCEPLRFTLSNGQPTTMWL